MEELHEFPAFGFQNSLLNRFSNLFRLLTILRIHLIKQLFINTQIIGEVGGIRFKRWSYRIFPSQYLGQVVKRCL